HIKSLIYSSLINNIQELHQRIQNAADWIRRRLGIFERVRNFIIRRCQARVERER
ncbi:hypothetical protein EAI_06371, partial [Harpegnathos saltator]